MNTQWCPEDTAVRMCINTTNITIAPVSIVSFCLFLDYYSRRKIIMEKLHSPQSGHVSPEDCKTQTKVYFAMAFPTLPSY